MEEGLTNGYVPRRDIIEDHWLEFLIFIKEQKEAKKQAYQKRNEERLARIRAGKYPEVMQFQDKLSDVAISEVSRHYWPNTSSFWEWFVDNLALEYRRGQK
jgi:hypothetical protein